MELPMSPKKKLKKPVLDGINLKTTITCSNVPEGLFDTTAAKEHFSKFGKLQKIRLLPKRQMCIIQYDQVASVDKAILNAGAYDGFMFDVTRTKPRVRKRSKKEEDPEWVPDSDVEEELSALAKTPTYRTPRQKPMDTTPPAVTQSAVKMVSRVSKNSPVRKKITKPETPRPPAASSGVESPVLISTTQTTMSTLDAAAELHQLRSRVSLTPDEQWRTLDARDRILRAWGGAGARVRVGGATLGTCPDMCPEKERLHRQAEHQVMTLETVSGSDGQLEVWRAVKQYSRSSADQEIPMCYELRPAHVLMGTCAYLLAEIADTERQVTLADWFHFMWDRFRGIRKDITQQALCCSESIQLVEMAARFHAHCGARLADLQHTQFDQKLNTDNLTKCLQTLKHMYTDVNVDHKPREAEFRGYIALLNLGDANFWWEIKQLPIEIQKSEAIIFAIKVFNALDNNNYVRFFRLIREEASYLQACILLRYCNDVRARALARILKAYAPRGGSKFPAKDLMSALAFESIDYMKDFIHHYGLRFAHTDDVELCVILDRHQFIDDSDPLPISRAIRLIESKRNASVGEVIAGGQIPAGYGDPRSTYCSFNRDGTLKESALIAEDQGYNTLNDSNKDVRTLKIEVQKLRKNGKIVENNVESKENIYSAFNRHSNSAKTRIPTVAMFANATNKSNLFSSKPELPVPPDSSKEIFSKEIKNIFAFSPPQNTDDKKNKLFSLKPDVTPESSKQFFTAENKHVFAFSPPQNTDDNRNKLFSIKPSIPVAPSDPSKHIFGNESKTIFTFSPPQNTDDNSTKLLSFKSATPVETTDSEKQILAEIKNKFSFSPPEKIAGSNVFPKIEPRSIFKNDKSGMRDPKTVFGAVSKGNNTALKEIGGNIFKQSPQNYTENNSLFKDNKTKSDVNANIFSNATSNIFAKPKNSIFGTATTDPLSVTKDPVNIFASANHNKALESKLFKQPIYGKTFTPNGETQQDLSPGTLFKSAVKGPEPKTYSVFQSKNQELNTANTIFNSTKNTNEDVYAFNEIDTDNHKLFEERRLHEEKIKQEQMELIRKQEERKLEEEKRKKEELKKKLEIEQQFRDEKKKKEDEEKRKKIEAENRKKEENLRKILEAEKEAERKRLAEEKVKQFRARVEKESVELVDVMFREVTDEVVSDVVKEEVLRFQTLISLANQVTEDILSELCNDICKSDITTEKIWSDNLKKKWFGIWKKRTKENLKRRMILQDTPVWLPNRSPQNKASVLRRVVENVVLKNMNAFHRGYRFSGKVTQFPPPTPYNIVEIIRSSLLKQMKKIRHPYDKCFFWKLTLVSPGTNKFICKKFDIAHWLLTAFSDRNRDNMSECLIHVCKQSWNNLMDFAVSVSMMNYENIDMSGVAMDGTNSVLFYFVESDDNLGFTIQQTLKHKYPYQIIPVAIILPEMKYLDVKTELDSTLLKLVSDKIILSYKIFVVKAQNLCESLNVSTKSALKWLARNYPEVPPLEVDKLKSICQRYLGNEIWCKLRSEKDNRMKCILKDIEKLIECYNTAVDKLTKVITNEDLFNYHSFPLEFREYLNDTALYPKPYEFIPSSSKTQENISFLKDVMNQLRLSRPVTEFQPMNVVAMQNQIRNYCNQLGWFDNSEQVVCKIVAVLPDPFSNLDITQEEFIEHYQNIDLVDFLNVIVYEKINHLGDFDNRFVIYERTVMEEYRNMDWLYTTETVSNMKHKMDSDVDDYLDVLMTAKRLKLENDSKGYLMSEFNDSAEDFDVLMKAKRRKFDNDSKEYLMLENKDSELVEASIKAVDSKISRLNDCKDTVKALEARLDAERQKSIELENLLSLALADV